MRWFMYSIVAILAISLGTISSFAQSSSTFDVKGSQGGQSYPVDYSLTGATVNDMSLDSNQTSLVISLQTTSDGNMTITLPRTLIDAKNGANDDKFFVLVDGTDTDFQESKTSTDRTLTMPFSDGSEKIEIIGTQVVPEFGSLSYVILVISILLIIAISTKSRFSFRF